MKPLSCTRDLGRAWDWVGIAAILALLCSPVMAGEDCCAAAAAGKAAAGDAKKTDAKCSAEGAAKACDNATTGSKPAAPKAAAPETGKAGMVVYLGPDGKPTTPPPGGVASAASAIPARSESPTVELATQANGRTVRLLRGDFYNASVATIGADGKVSVECVHGAPSQTESSHDADSIGSKE
jgi:hypothetical protein